MEIEPEKRVDEELLDSDGDLTIHEGVPFTGVGYDPFPDETGVEYETSYKDGLPHGYKRHWYLSGQLAYEIECEKGLKHGKETHWYPSGKVKSEAVYEFGFKLSSTTWNEKGDLIDEFSINRDSVNYKMLVETRKQHGREQ